MDTKFVGIKEFRQNIAGFARKASMKKARYVVVSHKKPLFEVVPFDEDETIDSYMAAAIEEGLRDIAEGRVHSEEEILKMFG